MRPPPMDTPPGWLMPIAAAIRESVGIPVVGVSRFTSPADAEDALSREWVDVVAFGRAFLTDPAWRELVSHVDYAAGKVAQTEVEFLEEAAGN